MAEKYDDGEEEWVDPIPCRDWTLFDAAQAIDTEACRLAAEQLLNEVPPDQDRFFSLVRHYKELLWEEAQWLLKVEYPFLDLENFSYHLQYFAIDGPEDPDDPDQYPEPDILEEGDYVLEEPSKEDSIPSAAELEDWI